MKKRRLLPNSIRSNQYLAAGLLTLPVFGCYSGGHVSTTPYRRSPTMVLIGTHRFPSYLEMLKAAAASFPSSVYDPPPESVSTIPSLNLNLGGVNVSLGGPTGSGVYRTSNDAVGVQADGLRDGVRSLIGKVKQGVGIP
jgi:vacuolar protein sorting-associated protein 45